MKKKNTSESIPLATRPGDPCGKVDCTGFGEFGTTQLSFTRCTNCSEFAYPSLYVKAPVAGKEDVE